MRRYLVSLACVASLCAVAATPGQAGPMTGAGLPSMRDATSLIENARVFCYNRYNGAFLHWGGCVPQGYYHPRVYCRSNYTGRFLHWGSCY